MARLLGREYSDPHAKITISVEDVDREMEVRYVREVAQILRAIRVEVSATRVVSRDTQHVQTEMNEVPISRLDVLDVCLPFCLLEKSASWITGGCQREARDLRTWMR